MDAGSGCEKPNGRAVSPAVPHSAFRIPHPAFRIPHSAFRIDFRHSAYRMAVILHYIAAFRIASTGR
jgi:hypothetical protein